MILVSEQQNFVKLRVSPKDFAEMSDDEAMKFLSELRGEREKEPTKRTTKPKSESAGLMKRGRKPAEINLEDAE